MRSTMIEKAVKTLAIVNVEPPWAAIPAKTAKVRRGPRMGVHIAIDVV